MGWLTPAFGVFGLACTAVIIATQADSFSPLLALPVAALGVATVAPRVGAIAMCAWCCISSLGLFMAPCAAAMVASARRTL
jgi:hypothetical protein